MPKGGARNRSGPPADPSSGRSDARGLVFTALPSEGFAGAVPTFPMPPHDFPEVAEREAQVWADAWRTPQACAWAIQSWRWPVIGEYVRLKVLCETNANASNIAQLHRYRDQLGLTPAGLRENGWAIASDEVGRKAAQRTDRPADAAPTERRLRAAGGDGGA